MPQADRDEARSMHAAVLSDLEGLSQQLASASAAKSEAEAAAEELQATHDALAAQHTALQAQVSHGSSSGCCANSAVQLTDRCS
jgi:hypothetical protein